MASSTSSLPFQCKWGFCTDRFSEQGVLRAHVQGHIKQEKFIRAEDLDVEIRNGQLYAREKESQGFGTFVHEQPRASTSNFVSQPSTSSSHSHPSTFLSHHTEESLAQPYINPSQIASDYPLPASLGPPPTPAPASATAVVPSSTHTDLSATSDLIPNSPATMSSSTSHSPASGAPAAGATPSPQRRTSGGFGTLPLGKKSVFGFGGNALRFGFGGGAGASSSSSGSSPSSGAVPSPARAPLAAASEVLVEPEKESSQDSNATRASLTSSANQTSPSSLGAQTQLEIQAVLAAHHNSQQQHSSPPSPSQHQGSQSSPPSSPHSFLGRQTQGEFTNRRHTPFPSSPPSNANDLSPSPTSQHRFLSPSAYENANEDEDQDDEDADPDGDALMSEFLVDDYESADGQRTNKGKAKATAKVVVGSSDAEQEELVEDELMTQAAPVSRKGR